MDIFLHKQYKAKIPDSIEAVREHFKAVLREPWYSMSENIMGEIGTDNEFSMHAKASIIFVKWEQTVTLTGHLEAADDKTIVYYTVKPSLLLFLACLFLAGWVLFEAFNLITGNGEFSDVKLVVALPILAFFIGVIQFSGTRLKRRFERIFIGNWV
jgi:hypothetical protein